MDIYTGIIIIILITIRRWFDINLERSKNNKEEISDIIEFVNEAFNSFKSYVPIYICTIIENNKRYSFNKKWVNIINLLIYIGLFVHMYIIITDPPWERSY